MARQPKLTIAELQTFCSTYVAAAKQAGTWAATRNNVYGLLDKIGEVVTIKGNFNNPLAPYIMGNSLNYGRTIEEFFVSLTSPVDAINVEDATGAEALKSYLPSIGEVSYSYDLGRKIIPTTVPYGNLEAAALNAENAGDLVADITEKQQNSQSLYEFGLCKQLIGNMAAKADAAGLSTVVGALDTTEAQESFIKTVKKDVESTKFAGENRSLSKELIGATPDEDLVLFVKKGVVPSIAVDTLAGAFHKDDLGFDCKVVVIDDFGLNDDNITAVLADVRGIKLKPNYIATRTNENGFADTVNIFRHSSWTGFLSKYTFVKEYKKA